MQTIAPLPMTPFVPAPIAWSVPGQARAPGQEHARVPAPSLEAWSADCRLCVERRRSQPCRQLQLDAVLKGMGSVGSGLLGIECTLASRMARPSKGIYSTLCAPRMAWSRILCMCRTVASRACSGTAGSAGRAWTARTATASTLSTRSRPGNGGRDKKGHGQGRNSLQ